MWRVTLGSVSDTLQTSDMRYMTEMFYNNDELVSINNYALTDRSNVINYDSMFEGCEKYTG